VAIEFHCEHCEHLIRAPNDTGGKKGRCPACKNVVYIPLPAEESGEIPLAPIDDAEERRRAEEEKRARAVEHQLLRHREVPGESGRSAARGAPAGPASAPADPRKLVAQFVSAMAAGQLEDADRVVRALARDAARAHEAIDAISADAAPLPGVGSVPRPVLMGFLKQLRSRL